MIPLNPSHFVILNSLDKPKNDHIRCFATRHKHASCYWGGSLSPSSTSPVKFTLGNAARFLIHSEQENEYFCSDADAEVLCAGDYPLSKVIDFS